MDKSCEIESGRTGSATSTRVDAGAVAFSPVRTVTVGSGISPDLLTSAFQSARGLRSQAPLPPVGSFTPPRERCRSGCGGGQYREACRAGQSQW